MERYLSIVLGDNCKISKTLIADESYKLDKYIYDNFKDSEQIRSRFKKEIEQFLDENNNLIKNIEQKNNKKYRGQIVILQVQEDGTLRRIKVIYKKEIIKVKELLSDQEFMKKFVAFNRNYFTEHIFWQTRRKKAVTFYNNMMSEFYRYIKNSEDFFQFCRSILKFAEVEHKVEYRDISKDTNLELENYSIDSISDECDDSYDPDQDFHPDLDDIASGKYPIEDKFIEEPIEEPKAKTKVKTKKDPNQLSFFD